MPTCPGLGLVLEKGRAGLRSLIALATSRAGMPKPADPRPGPAHLTGTCVGAHAAVALARDLRQTFCTARDDRRLWPGAGNMCLAG